MYTFQRNAVLRLDGEDMVAATISRNENTAQITCQRVPKPSDDPLRTITIHVSNGNPVRWTGQVARTCVDGFIFEISKSERLA